MTEKKYIGLVISQERLERNWSQEDLCKGICTVSYLSKIETGKAEPSGDILQLLFERLGLTIDPKIDDDSKIIAEEAYTMLFSCMEDRLRAYLADVDCGKYRTTSFGLDLMLLKKAAFPEDPELKIPPEGLADCMSSRQLALYRIIRGRPEDAVLYYPNAYTYLQAGLSFFRSACFSDAIHMLQTAYVLASMDGYAIIMLKARLAIGNCFFNLMDSPNMQKNYEIAMNLAYAINEPAAQSYISYYLASNNINLGEYEKAYYYFSKLKNPKKLDLHKLAICCEKTGRKQEALQALDRADLMQAEEPIKSLVNLICSLVRYRLEHEDYLEQSDYGELLQKCYNESIKQRPKGFDIFHVPWMIEWYQATRQYKKIYELISDYPGLSFIKQ